MSDQLLTLKCTVLRISKNLELGAFSDKQFCEIAGPVFFPLWLKMLISFLNDVDIQLTLEFKNIFGKYHLVCPKNP